ncbi:MAG: hypothetical protein WD648_14925 [Planctomycetaceae bacterium]
MSASSDDILKAALQLSEQDRLEIASRLLETVPEEPPGLSADSPEFFAELERRSGRWEDAIPWEEVKDKLRKSP